MPSLRKAVVQFFICWSPGTGSQSSRLHPMSQQIDGAAGCDVSLLGVVQLGPWLCAVRLSVAVLSRVGCMGVLCSFECSSECCECSVYSLRKNEADNEWRRCHAPC